ncbi:hypothetical protein ACFYO0_04685 [Streptomyces sp. NPDC006365]|uniref:hypothetical protein n=1 Tax=Streptomyces sp. NPDC006365 TaxID=3364744 RepID=UPI0036A94839
MNPTPESRTQIMRGLVGHLAVHGYRIHVQCSAGRWVLLLGDALEGVDQLGHGPRRREIALVRATSGDSGGEHTLTAPAT